MRREDSLGQYLREIGRYPIPTLEQEQQWSREIYRWTAFRDDEMLRATISAAEFERIAKVGKRAKDQMVKCNLRLVVKIAKNYQNRGLELIDLIQEGAIGLNRGAEKFDPMKGWKFSTYAYWWIRQAITRAISEKSRTIRLPVHITEKLNKIKKTARQFSQKHGRMPTSKELRELKDENGELILDAPTIALAGSDVAMAVLSLDRPMNSPNDKLFSSDTSLMGLIADDSSPPDEIAEKSEVLDVVTKLIDRLPEKQRFVIEQRYGLDGNLPKTLSEAAIELGISRERVRQIQAKAMRRLKTEIDWSPETLEMLR